MIAFPTIGLALLIFAYTFLCCLCLPVVIWGPGLTLLLGILTFASIPHCMRRYMGMGGSNTKYKWLDYVVGLLMSPLIIPFNSHKKEHLAHHAHTNSDEDPDVHLQNMFESVKDCYKKH